MWDDLKRALDIIVPLFAISSMLSVGLAYSLREFIAPLRNVRLILGALVSNFLLVPSFAALISALLPLAEPFRMGLVLLSTAAGAVFMVRLTAAANEDLAAITALLLTLLVATIIYMPIVIPLALPGAEVNPVSIAIPLISTMLLPLIIGISLRGLRPFWAIRLQSIANQTSQVSLAGMLLLVILIHLPALLGLLGSGAILAAILLTVGGYSIGYLVGVVTIEHRAVLGIASGQRNIAAATVVASQNFDHPNVLIMVIVTSVVGLLILYPIAWTLRRKRQRLSYRQPATSFTK